MGVLLFGVIGVLCWALVVGFRGLVSIIFDGDGDDDTDPTGCVTGSWEDEGGL